MGVKFEKVSKEIQIHPEAFKRKVVEEYVSGTCSKMDHLRKYGIKTKSGIQRWMKSLGYVDRSTEVMYLIHQQLRSKSISLKYFFKLGWMVQL